MPADVYIHGAATTPMSGRGHTAEELALAALQGALDQAGLAADEVGLVVVANATAGRLLDQSCIRGQTFLGRAGLAGVGIVNVDNTCGSGTTALHMATLAARAGVGAVVALGVEKMWTGDRAATLAGIEDGVPKIDRLWMHAHLENPSGSVLMAVNAAWATQLLAAGATREEFAAVVEKNRMHGMRNPHAQVQQLLTRAEVLAAPEVVAPLTRPMCSSFTDGAAAVVLSARPLTGATRIRASVLRSGNGDLDYHGRMAQSAAAAWEEAGVGPEDMDVAELHDATAPEELYSLESLGFYAPGTAGRATLAGDTALGGRGVTVNPSGGLLVRGHPLGATGIAQVVELDTQLRGAAGPRQVARARLAVAVNVGGIIGSHRGEPDNAVVGTHVLQAGRFH